MIPLLQIGSYAPVVEAALREVYEVHRWWELADPDAFLARVGARIRAVATDGGRGLPRAIMDRLPALEVISVNGVGVDAVDLDEARRRGIGVGHTPGVLTGDVADLAVGMFLGLVRRIPEADAFARSGRWAEGAFPLTRRVGGMRAGVLGLGRIGEAIARRLGAFDVEVAYTSREPKDVPYEFVPDAVALAERSDVLVVALAATPETRHAVDARVIEALGPRGLLVNISRAANVDEGALLDALEGGRLGGAALDVFEGEPRIDPRWAMLPNVLLQPHAGSGTVETRAAMAQMMRDNLAAHFAGRPLPARAA